MDTKRKEKEEEKKREGMRRRERERKEKKGFPLLFKIYGNRVVGFRRSKRQSSSTRRELYVGMRIWGFLQTPRGRGFSYLGYF